MVYLIPYSWITTSIALIPHVMFAYTLSLGLALVLHHIAARLSYVLLILTPAVHGYHDVCLFVCS